MKPKEWIQKHKEEDKQQKQKMKVNMGPDVGTYNPVPQKFITFGGIQKEEKEKKKNREKSMK